MEKGVQNAGTYLQVKWISIFWGSQTHPLLLNLVSLKSLQSGQQTVNALNSEEAAHSHHLLRKDLARKTTRKKAWNTVQHTCGLVQTRGKQFLGIQRQFAWSALKMTARTSKTAQYPGGQFRRITRKHSNKQQACWQQPSTHTNCSFSNTLTLSEPAFIWDMKDAGDHSSGPSPAQCMSCVQRGREGRAAQVREGRGWAALPIWDRHLQVLSSKWGVSTKFPVCAEHLFTDVCWKGTSDLYRKKDKVALHCNLLSCPLQSVQKRGDSCHSLAYSSPISCSTMPTLSHPLSFTFKIDFLPSKRRSQQSLAF